MNESIAKRLIAKKLLPKKEGQSDATARFQALYSRAKAKVGKVAEAIDQMAADQKTHPDDYSFAGSLGHVDEQLNNLLQFLGYDW